METMEGEHGQHSTILISLKALNHCLANFGTLV